MTLRRSNSCAAMRTACAAPPARSGSRRPPSSRRISRTPPRSGSSIPGMGWRTEGRPRAASFAGWRRPYSRSSLRRPPPPPPPSLPPLAAPSPPPSADVPEVIVVEDDPALAELLSFGLEARGYRFVHFRNGREALDLLKTLDTRGSSQPPLLLLDVDLPALDGYSIFEELQQQCPGKFRVVFTTVHGSETEQLRGLEAGAMDYMVKPMSLRVALEKIRRWVGR